MALGAGMDFCEGFHCRIKRFFNDYHFSLWDLNKSLSSFKGKDCRAFVKNAASLADWIENTELLVTDGDEEWEGMIGALRTYKKLHDFMAKTIIEDKDKEKYEEEIN